MKTFRLFLSILFGVIAIFWLITFTHSKETYDGLMAIIFLLLEISSDIEYMRLCNNDKSKSQR